MEGWQPDRVQIADRRIRDLIDSPRLHIRLRGDRRKWFQICAALDAVGDTQLAVRAYQDNEVHADGDGGNYVIVYGLLQAIYVQQDAALKIAEVLGIRCELPATAAAVRRTRNAAVGHPAEYRNKQSATIVRVSLSRLGFEFYVWRADGESEREQVDLASVCKEHTECIGEFLEQVINKLIQDELMHRREHRGQLLADAFPAHIDYAYEKIGDGIRALPADPAIGDVGLSMVTDALDKFHALLAKRGLAEAITNAVNPSSDDARFAVQRLRELFAGQLSGFDERDGRAYRVFLKESVTTLRDVAAEIDAEYASDDV